MHISQVSQRARDLQRGTSGGDFSCGLQWCRVKETLLVAKSKTLAFRTGLALGRTEGEGTQASIAAVKIRVCAAVVPMRDAAGDIRQRRRGQTQRDEDVGFHIVKKFKKRVTRQEALT